MLYQHISIFMARTV